MRSSICGAMALVLTGALALTARPAAGETLVAFTAVLNGAQENPPTNSPSQGVAQVILVKETNTVCYRISYSPLAGTEVLAHFHGRPRRARTRPCSSTSRPCPHPSAARSTAASCSPEIR